MIFFAARPLPETIDGVNLRVSTRAKNLGLRFDPRMADVVLIWPQNLKSSEKNLKRAHDFVARHQGWIEKHRYAVPAQHFAAGAQIPFQGRILTVVHQAGRGVTKIDGDILRVYGDARHLARRIKDFLKQQAHDAALPLVRQKEKIIKVSPAKLRMADPKARWGSCSSEAKLMLSWRLIMAPPAVLDYVVAHEVAHRLQMNHGRKFWALCLSLCEDGAKSRRWLKQNGAGLLAWR